jgi:hypothetical protein
LRLALLAPQEPGPDFCMARALASGIRRRMRVDAAVQPPTVHVVVSIHT